MQAIKSLLPASDPLLAAARADATVLAFALGLSLLTAVLFGMLPALSGSHATRRIVRAGRGTERCRAMRSWRVEVALSMVLLAGAAVLLRGLMQISHAPLGYSSDDVTML